MTKEELINDYKFREACNRYNLNCGNCEIYNDVILLNTPKNDLYILLDQNYNVITIENIRGKSKEAFVEEQYEKYSTELLPFIDYTLKQLRDVSNRAEIQIHTVRINGDDYNKQTDNPYIRLLSYVKFLDQEIDQYHQYTYRMKILGFEVADIYQYMKTLISKIDECIEMCIKNAKYPWSSDILEYIGKTATHKQLHRYLYECTPLLLLDKGAMSSSENPWKVEQLETPISNNYLSSIASEVLKVLEISDEDFKSKEKANDEQKLKIKLDNFNSTLAEDIDE